MFSRNFQRLCRSSGAMAFGARSFASKVKPSSTFNKTFRTVTGVVGLGLAASTLTSVSAHRDNEVDYSAVRAAIVEILDNDNWDDGSIGPVLVRLAWHASGTYDINDGTGGSGTGASMRFFPEAGHGANAGLEHARAFLEPIKARFPNISYADLWTLAGVTAIEEMGGPAIKWRPGRVDCSSAEACTPDGRLPDAAQGAQHLRDIFYRQGFNDQEIVALSGAHSLGRCHTDRSGFDGPWTNAPTTFSNLYFQDLLNRKWTWRNWSGPAQYQDETKKLMMLPSDMSLIEDKSFRQWVEIYADDEELFAKDFAKAFQKLTENNVNFTNDHRVTPKLVLAGFLAALGLGLSK